MGLPQGVDLERADPSRTRLGWIGTGVMGSSMCGHLVAAGYRVAVCSRTPAKAAPLVEAGAELRSHPGEVAADSDIVFVMVGYPSEVEQVVLGAGGVVERCRPGTVIIDMTTNDPAMSADIARRAGEQGAHALDAPVSGGDVGARAGRLSIMVGGDPSVLEAVRPCLELLGATIVHQGGPGAGQHTKLVNQTLIAGTMVSLCEALLYASRAGLDPHEVLRSVAVGAAGSWSLDNLAPRILAGDYQPGFYVDHFVKDLGLVLESARRLRLSMPGLALAEQLYVALQAQGHGRLGTQALHLALARLSASDQPS